MILKSFGCSFIFGTDLADDGRNQPKATPSNCTWPALLAKSQGWDYSCSARPGSGNLQILQRLIEQLPDNDPLLFYVIGWSWIDRFDYTDGRDWWQTLMPIDTTSIATNYYRDLHSQYRDKLTSLICIKTAIDILNQHNIPFVMTHMDDLLFEDQWHTDASIRYLQNFVRPYIKKFDGKTFLNWSKEKGFEISPTLHPLEQAHKAAAEYAKNHFLV